MFSASWQLEAWELGASAADMITLWRGAASLQIFFLVENVKMIGVHLLLLFFE
jgi:hypothetical protein